MRIAIIDCGTNTFHLLIVEFKESGNYRVLFKSKSTVKLGQGGITKNIISAVPFKRGILALQQFNKRIIYHKAGKVIAFATAAVRNAKNGEQFIHAAKAKAGISIKLISGNREAELIYKGVNQAMNLGQQTSLIIDIGGGSTEFIICNGKKIFWRKSFPLGAALLLEKFKPADPISPAEIQLLNSFLEKNLTSLFKVGLLYQPKMLIGSSGSFETFAAMICFRKGTMDSLFNKTSYRFNMKDYRNIHQQLIQSTSKERMQMKGLVKMRVDMIVLASLLLTFVLEKTQIRKMTLSTFALKEGILTEVAESVVKSKKRK